MKTSSLRSEMTALDAVELYKLFDRHGIKVWIDGGWGVDALLGHQTRKHDDLDVAIYYSSLTALSELLKDRGYRHVPSAGSWGCNFVLGQSRLRQTATATRSAFLIVSGTDSTSDS